MSAEDTFDGGEEVPEGFVEVSREYAAYFRIEKGAKLIGKLVGHRERTDKPGQFTYSIEVSKPTPAQRSKKVGTEFVKEIVTLNPGETIVIDDRPGLSHLAKHMGKEVYICAVDKKPIKGGKTMWVFKTAVAKDGGKVPF